MIKKVKISVADREKLKNIIKIDPLRNNSAADDNFDYTGIVINKPWGHEYLAFKNNEVAVWILCLKEGSQTSMHCHPNKKTSIVVLEGEALCSTLNSRTTLSAGQGFLLDKGVFHSTKALPPRGLTVMETETPTNKRDLVRLEDQYGRAHKDYEGKEHYRAIADAYGRIGKIHQGAGQFTISTIDSAFESFHDEKERYNNWKRFGACELSIIKQANRDGLKAGLNAAQADILALLQGKIFDARDQCILEAGDLTSWTDLKNHDFNIFKEVEFLILRKNSL